MDWIEIKIRCSARTADVAAQMLEQLGALAVTYQDAADSPILEPRPGERRLWPSTEVTGLFAKDVDPNPIVSQLQLILGDSFPIKALTLPDQDWVRAWMDAFKPICCGRRLWICPSWQQVPDPDAVTVMLDPGLAFGTGTHPTTFLCLQWLDEMDLTGKTVLDYGCGSGILAAAALKLGAQSACGVDIDPQALTASRANAERNQVSDRLALFDGSKPQDLNFAPCDAGVANILAGPLAELEPKIAALLKPGAPLALSGILDSQAEETAAAYAEDFELLGIKVKEGWARLGLRRKG